MQGGEIAMTTAVGRNTPGSRREPLRTDPVERAIAEGLWTGPGADWAPLNANAEGWLSGPATRGGYVAWTFESPQARTMLLEAVGHTMAYVNGAPRAGDPYGYGYVSLPVEVKAGKNEILFQVGRGRVRAKLVEPPAPVSLDVRDATLPDLVDDARGRSWGAVIVRNATTESLKDLEIEAGRVRTKLAAVPPMTVRKVGFEIDMGGPEEVDLRLRRGGRTLHESQVKLRRREPGQPYKRTFISGIDGSVQYFAINPSTRDEAGQALFLSLHGASVEASGQAEAYSAKTWGHLVAPTNRRPYGFDWEEIGRLDALEVLEIAQRSLKTDPRKTYLTGHSMGGHGTWQIGVQYPDRFAAIAPAAGWIAFSTYGGGVEFGTESPIQNILRRAGMPSYTLALKQNYAIPAIFILHGDADETVPVAQARRMREELKDINRRLLWHEEPGQGHWYDTDPEAGANCVDYAPIFDLFARTRVPESREMLEYSFTTASPGVSAKCFWIEVIQQTTIGDVSRVDAKASPHNRQIDLKTTNVSRIRVKPDALTEGPTMTVVLDGQKIEGVPTHADGANFVRNGDRWRLATDPDLTEKGPHRYGGIKDVFRNRVLFVYGTSGSAEENAWAYNKARFDAESFWYRGNGAVDVIPDREFDAKTHGKRNVILYGTRDSNSATKALIPENEYHFWKGSAKVGDRTTDRTDVGIMMLRPSPFDPNASVLAVGGTGLVGMRLTDRMPIFTSGAAFPDYWAVTPESLTDREKGVWAAGFFDHRWRVGDFASGS